MIPEEVLNKYGLSNSGCESDSQLYHNFLDLTDYEVIKALESGEVMDEDLKAFRQFARDEINRLGE